MTPTVLILGASGKTGTHSTDAFCRAGWTIRRYQRGTDMVKAARGCEVIVNGPNPPDYHNWAETIPAITGQVIAAARASGASVILPGNVYNFGHTLSDKKFHRLLRDFLATPLDDVLMACLPREVHLDKPIRTGEQLQSRRAEDVAATDGFLS